MTQEDEKLLLEDICSRIPYGVIGKFKNSNQQIYGIFHDLLEGWQVSGITLTESISNVKLYLFPLESMTEEQKKEYNHRKHNIQLVNEWGCVVEKGESFDSPESFEYLIENHFDYHGLILLGLAIDATGLGIYK